METTEMDIAGLGAPNSKKNPAAAAIKALRIQENKLTGNRDKFLNRLGLFPKEIAEGIATNRIQLVDHVVYSSKFIGAKSQIDIVTDADVKKTGLTNFNRARFENGEYFLLCGIRVRYDGAAIDSEASILAANFADTLAGVIRNGEMTLEINQKKILDKFPLSVFDSLNNSNVDKGYYPLENPKPVMYEQLIKASLFFAAAADVTKALRFEMVGILTQRN